MHLPIRLLLWDSRMLCYRIFPSLTSRLHRIIFVHGLFGDPYKTWASKPSKRRTKSPQPSTSSHPELPSTKTCGDNDNHVAQDIGLETYCRRRLRLREFSYGDTMQMSTASGRNRKTPSTSTREICSLISLISGRRLSIINAQSFLLHTA